MGISEEFSRYVAHLCQGLGHADRHAGFSGYCTGLMLPLPRKSIEPMAARVDPLHASARHQALHHFVAKSEWSDAAIMASVRNQRQVPAVSNNYIPRGSASSAAPRGRLDHDAAHAPERRTRKKPGPLPSLQPER